MDAAANKRETYTLIRDLPVTDRPRERLRDFGADSLSNQELIAILLRTGSSKESAILQPDKSLPGGMRTVREPSVSEAAKGFTPKAG